MESKTIEYPALPKVDSPASPVSSTIPTVRSISKEVDIEAQSTTETTKDSEQVHKPEQDNKDTYLHGIKLVLVFIALALSLFIIILDQTILIPAIPVIASAFGAVDQIGWISSSYFVTQTSSILLWGQALAFFDQKMPLILAIGIFELGSLIAAVARNFTTLIVGRAVAGLGGAAIMVATMSISSVVIELKRRPIFFGLFSVVFVLGSSLGPIIGGSFTSHATWRWCFWINLPIGGLSMVAISWLIPKLDSPPKKTEKHPHLLLRGLKNVFGDKQWLGIHGFIGRVTSLDWIGGVILLCGVISLTLALTDGGAHGWSTRTVIVGLTMSGVALILLILWEALVMRDDGMVPLRLARYSSIWGAAGVAAMRMINSLVILTYLPTFLQATRHQSALRSAISTLPYAIGMAVFALIGSTIVQKTGRYKWALVSGSAVAAVGAGLLYTLHVHSSYAKMAGLMVVAALGAGLVQMNAMLAAQADMKAQGLVKDIPQATALCSVFQLLGASIGGSLGGAVLTTGLRKYASSLPPAKLDALLASVEEVWQLSGDERATAVNAYTRSMDNVFLVGVVAGGLGLVFALICRDHNLKGNNPKK